MTTACPDPWTRVALDLARSRRRLVGPCWRLAVAAVAGPVELQGRDRLPAHPVVLAANHASHADTLVLLAVLRERSVLPAAAADYFFATRPRALATVGAVGGFPFPRQGRAGLDRALAVLAAGHDVLLFPQGTREGGPVRPGVGRLVEAGATVVPVRLEGTAAILPKGARWPRRHPVRVSVGAPVVAGTCPDGTTRQVAAHLGLEVAGRQEVA